MVSGVNITIGKRFVVLFIEQYMNSNIQMGSCSVVMKTLVLATGFTDMDFQGINNMIMRDRHLFLG